jgi:hypothetical protein
MILLGEYVYMSSIKMTHYDLSWIILLGQDVYTMVGMSLKDLREIL